VAIADREGDVTRTLIQGDWSLMLEVLAELHQVPLSMRRDDFGKASGSKHGRLVIVHSL
jgi:aminoglycoside phosphotransferase (APT) family kinase protein